MSGGWQRSSLIWRASVHKGDNGTSGKMQILLVDDRPANLLALEGLLARPNRIFLRANAGSEALKLALNKEVDLILLDVQMPGMDGFEVAQILKSNKRTKDIPIIFASAEKKDHKFMMKGFEEGGVDYLFKPLDPDITEAKVAVLLKLQAQRKELMEKNQSLENASLLINNSIDIIGIIDGSTLKFEEVNRSFETNLGYTLKDTLGTSLMFFLPEDDRRTIEKIRDPDKKQLSFETRFYCKDRSIKWLHWNVAVKHGKWFLNARDITQLKEAERIRNYLATVVKQSEDAIYIHDHEGRIISWNEGAERIYGYNEREALNMKIWNIIPEYLQPETNDLLTEIGKGDKVFFREAKRITKHGTLVDVIFSAALLTEPNQGRSSMAITERDITKQKLADQQIRELNGDLEVKLTELEQVNHELESFSYSISHDLRSPLRALAGYATIISEDYAEKLDAEAGRLLGNIHRNVQRMGSLIDDLLEFSRLGKKPVEKTALDVDRLVAEVIADVIQFSGKKTEFKLGPLPGCEGDPSLIRQVWQNLISNAVKYSGTRENPRVEIAATREEDKLVYSVKDNGVGFDEKYADKQFQVFQRLHRPDEFEGTGIGLAIVNRIVARHHGRVGASATPGQGATFWFELPA
jgi:PAS domain S-box-containing protein